MKNNVERHYAVIGILELFKKSMRVFEAKIPLYFANFSLVAESVKIRRVWPYPNDVDFKKASKQRKIVCQRLSIECELYEYLKQRLLNQFKQITSNK